MTDRVNHRVNDVRGGSLREEYVALRRGVGAHRLDRDVLWVRGPDAVAYLQGQCSQDVAGLPVGAGADSLLLGPEGKLNALVRVVRCADDGFLLDVDAGFGEAVAARLSRFKLRSKLAISSLPWSCVAMRGDGVTRLPGLGGVTPGDPDPGDPTPPGPIPVEWGRWAGVDLMGPAPEAAVPGDARWCGDEAWEACRVESGIPVMGAELDERTIAAEAGLVERTVSFTKGCFTGQELVARLDARGNRVPRRLCGVVLLDAAEEDTDHLGAVRGAPLVEPGSGPGGKELGKVTSVAWCPGLGTVGGLAYAHRSVSVPGPIVVDASGGGLAAELRPLPMV